MVTKKLKILNSACRVFWDLALILLIRSGDVELNPGPSTRMGMNACVNVLYSNIRGLSGNHRELSLCAQNFDVVFCSETLASSRRSPVELLIQGFNKPILKACDTSHSGGGPGCRGMALYIRSGCSAFRRPRYECSCHETMCVRVCGQYHNFYIFAIYRSPNSDDRIYECLLEQMTAIQGCDPKAAFAFIGDFNAHHREWLGSVSVTDSHGLAALNFSSESGMDQLISEPTHQGGNVLDLVFTDVPDVVTASVGTPIGRSDHSYLSLRVEVARRIPDIVVSQKVYLKSRVNWEAVSSELSNVCWSQIYRDEAPASRLTEVLVDIMERRVPSRTLRRRLRDKPWFNDNCRRAYRAKQQAYRRWTRGGRDQSLWDEYLVLRSEASSVYAEAEYRYNLHARGVLEECTESHKWWTTLKSSIFGSDSSMPPLMTSSGAVSNAPRDRSELLSDVFKSKQCSDTLELPPTCFPEASLKRFALKSKEIHKLLSDLDPHGGLDSNGLLPIFLKKNSAFLAPKLAVVFRILIRSGDFPQIWRSANVTPIPKSSPPSIYPEDYRPISITPCISKVFERVVSARLVKYVEDSHLVPDGQFAYRKGLGTCDALLSLVGSFQSHLDKNKESCAVSLDFSAAFDRINHRALIYKLRSIGIGGPFLEIIINFLASRSQSVIVDGFRGRSDSVVSGVPQGSVLGPLLFVIFTSDMWSVVSNDLVAYADDATLFASIDSPADRSVVVQSLNEDLASIVLWCETWGMKLNPKKTQAIIFSRSRTPYPAFPSLKIGNETLVVKDSMEILGVILDNKLTFEKHIRSLCSSLSRTAGLLRKCNRVYRSQAILKNCFYSFLLPSFEYCAPVWCSAADSHLILLDRVLHRIEALIPDLNIDLRHRRSVASMCMFFKIINNPRHPLHSFIPPASVPARRTRYSMRLNTRSLFIERLNTSQFQRCFVPRCVEVWNFLPNDLVEMVDLQKFKVGVNVLLLQQHSS